LATNAPLLCLFPPSAARFSAKKPPWGCLKTCPFFIYLLLLPIIILAQFKQYEFHDWQAYKKGMRRMTKREIIRSLILSPLYLTLKLKDRALLIRKTMRRMK
jgi:hypothetical protein